MANSFISPEDAGLVLHRLVTEQLPVVALFSSADDSVKIAIHGFVNNFTRDVGLSICTPFAQQKPIPATLRLPHDLIVASTFRYSDDSETPKESEVGSGLKIEMPNGNSLTIMEVRD